MARHLGLADEWYDLEQGYYEMRGDDHADWCHWACVGHRSCGCHVDKDFSAIASGPPETYDIAKVKATLREILLRSALNA